MRHQSIPPTIKIDRRSWANLPRALRTTIIKPCPIDQRLTPQRVWISMDQTSVDGGGKASLVLRHTHSPIVQRRARCFGYVYICHTLSALPPPSTVCRSPPPAGAAPEPQPSCKHGTFEKEATRRADPLQALKHIAHGALSPPELALLVFSHSSKGPSTQI